MVRFAKVGTVVVGDDDDRTRSRASWSFGGFVFVPTAGGNVFFSSSVIAMGIMCKFPS
jgi:hypothetical protein